MRYLKTLSFLFLAILLAQPAFAAQKNTDINRQELKNFDRFLDAHPAIEKDLQKNPALVQDSAYLAALRRLIASFRSILSLRTILPMLPSTRN